VTDGRPLVVVGDVLLDRDVRGRVERLSPDAPVPVVDEEAVRSRPGGAGLSRRNGLLRICSSRLAELTGRHGLR